MENISALMAQKPNEMYSSEKWAVNRKNFSQPDRNNSVAPSEQKDSSEQVPKNSFDKVVKKVVEREGKDENENSIKSQSENPGALETKREKESLKETNESEKKGLISKKNQKSNLLENAELFLNVDSEGKMSENSELTKELVASEKKSNKNLSQENVALDSLKTGASVEASLKVQTVKTKKEKSVNKNTGEKNEEIVSLDKDKKSHDSIKTTNGSKSKFGKVEVVDFRENEKSNLTSISGKEKNDNQRISKPVVFRLDGNNTSGNTLAIAETSIDLPSQFGSENDVSRAAAELAKKLDAQAGSDIVKQVKVVLQKADVGEIRINLHPDNLGRVKVQIKIENHVLKGQIFVESAAAREAFGSALEGLKTKLIESGFSGADLELAWSDNGNASSEKDNHNHKPMRDMNIGLKNFENMIETIGESNDAADSYVNMVV